MAFTFIHSADWQLGKPFNGFPDDIRPLLLQARLDAIGRVAAAARAARARHVIVAGDVFDSRTPSADLRKRAFSILAAEKDIVWHLLPGNHDPAETGSFWLQPDATSRPPNVRFLVTAAPVEIEPGVSLLPAPLAAKSMATDPTAWMDTCVTPQGTIRIGVAHGSVQGFGSDGDAAVPIAPERPRLAGLAYLALGDWHGVTKISDRAWYSGTPEPDQFPSNRPGFVLRVDLADAHAPPRITEVATARYTWTKRALAVSAAMDIEPLSTEIAASGATAQQQLIELTLSGSLSFAEMGLLDAALDDLAAGVRLLRRKTEQLTVHAAAGDVSHLPAGVVRAIAERLQRQAAEGDDVASDALRKLINIAADAQVQAVP
jgi:DNA repair exonuclease SbcCD nuclease subunit